MPASAIEFHSEDVDVPITDLKRAVDWINQGVALNGGSINQLNFIFVNDERLYQINLEYLSHDYYTDVITFDYSDESGISGDIFISLDRVKENAEEFGEPFMRELSRVMIHGVLHLLGFGDKSLKEKEKMRREEENLLTLCPYL